MTLQSLGSLSVGTHFRFTDEDETVDHTVEGYDFDRDTGNLIVLYIAQDGLHGRVAYRVFVWA